MGEEDTNGPKNETFFWGATNDGPKPRHFVFGYVTSGPSRRPFFLGEGEGQNRSGPKTRLFLFLGNITNGPETRLCFFFGGAGGTKTRLWRQLDSRSPKMQVAPGWPFFAETWRHVHLYPLGAASSTRVLPNYSGGKN